MFSCYVFTLEYERDRVACSKKTQCCFSISSVKSSRNNWYKGYGGSCDQNGVCVCVCMCVCVCVCVCMHSSALVSDLKHSELVC